MDITWLGAAGFIVRGKEGEIVFDPFLSRGEGEKSPFSTKSFENSRVLFVGHGHFDHTYDIPKIAKGTDLQIYAPGMTGRLLKSRGVSGSRIHNAGNKETLFSPYKVRAFRSTHVKFDIPLVASTIKRCGIGSCLDAFKLGALYPMGMIQTYLFEMEGKKVLFISSGGCTDKELRQYRDLEVDYLLAPLQGHTDIQNMIARMTVKVAPKVVIPHHHDDFYPPLSQEISIDEFRERLQFHGFNGDLLEIPLFQSSIV